MFPVPMQQLNLVGESRGRWLAYLSSHIGLSLRNILAAAIFLLIPSVGAQVEMCITQHLPEMIALLKAHPHQTRSEGRLMLQQGNLHHHHKRLSLQGVSAADRAGIFPHE